MTRFSPKRPQAQRSRLDLRAADFGTLLEVSAKSMYYGQSEKKLAAVYVVCLFGFIIWAGFVISWFLHLRGFRRLVFGRSDS